jgi:hypothetical protein
MKKSQNPLFIIFVLAIFFTVVFLVIPDKSTNKKVPQYSIADPYYYVIKDGEVWLYYSIKATQVELADPASFEQVHEYYGVDKDSAFYLSKRIEYADPMTFTVINKDFSGDDESIFYRGDVLADVDSSTFIILDEYYSTDINNVFFKGDLLEWVEPTDFQVIENCRACAKDNEGTLYYLGEPFTGNIDELRVQAER